MMAYIISGFFAGLAGIAYAATFSSSVAPGTGPGLELDAIGGAIIGGTSMTGGQGSYVMNYSHDERTPPNVQQKIVATFKPRADEE